MGKGFEECVRCRHWYPKKKRCTDTFYRTEKFDIKTQKMVCTRYDRRHH